MGKKIKEKKANLFLLLLLVCGLLLTVSFTGRASSLSMVEKFFTTEELQEDYFSQQVLNQVSMEQLEAIRKEYTAGLGEYLGAEKVDEHIFNVNFSGGVIEFQLVLNSEGEIAGLYFLSVVETATGLEEVVTGFEELPGEVSLLISSDGDEMAALNPDLKLAVGSTFKLAVLKALQDEIESGNHEWDEVVKLEEEHRSLPTGYLQDWPAGSPLTLHTLAVCMISVSDNTATDVLIDFLGRGRVEEEAPGNRPFLKTREAFVLKAPENEDLLKKYREADQDEKYELLAETENMALPSIGIFDQVRAPDIEWFFSLREIEELMLEVKDLELMSINPGVVRSGNWKKAAYKGGSEPGVMNLTTWLEDENGSSYFVSATWNHDQPLDEDRFIKLYQQLTGQLKTIADKI